MSNFNTERYPIVNLKRGEGSPSPHMEIICSKCPATAAMPWSGGKRAAPPAMVNNYFRERGWSIGHNRTNDKCPACNPRLGKAKAHAGLNKLSLDLPAEQEARSPPAQHEETRTTQETATMNDVVTLPVVARVPTRGDRRLIMDEIAANYVEDVGYKGSASDASVAAKLNFPRIWVAEIREEFYGPDTNEAAQQVRADLASLLTRAKSLEEQGLKLATEGEALRKEAERLSNRLPVKAA